MKPSPSETRLILELIAHMRRLLKTPVSIEEIEAQFALLAAGLKVQKGADSLNTAAAYLIAMEGFSSWAVRRTVRDILKGQAEGFSKTFMPSSAELAAYCAALQKKAAQHSIFLERLLAAKEEISPFLQAKI